MRCGKVRRNLMSYHDGELDQASADRISGHLETCRDCTRRLDALKRADQAAGSAGVPSPDPEYWDTFTDRVMQKVKTEPVPGRADPGRLQVRPWFRPVRLAPALSIALVVVVAAGVLLKTRQPALREIPFLEGEAVTRSLEGEEDVRSDLEKGTAASSFADESGGQDVALPEEAKTAPAPVVGSAAEKREAAASGAQRDIQPGEERGIETLERDGFSFSPPPEADARAARSPMKSFAGETTPPSGMPAMEAERSPLTPDAVHDGSWGQLAFANKLEAEGKHVHSQEVLEDLLARNPAAPVREEASFLLVRVLENQNRMPEAREVLEDAQRQYPANTAIQNYRIE